MKVLFIDFANRKNDKSYQTAAKVMTASGVVRILRVHVPMFETSAEVIVQRGTWKSPTEWWSPSGQYCIELVEDD